MEDIRVSGFNPVSVFLIIIRLSIATEGDKGMIMIMMILIVPVVMGWSNVGGAIYDDSGGPFMVRGMNWYGAELPNRVVEGLWVRGVGSHLEQMVGEGVNTVRIPIALQGIIRGDYDTPIEPDLIRGCSDCGSDPTSYDVLRIIMDTCASLRIGVILDMHRLYFLKTSPLWYSRDYSEADMLSGWNTILGMFGSHPALMGIDLYNEPHGIATIGTGDDRTDWDAFVVRALGALEIPQWKLVFVGGIAWGEDMRRVAGSRIPTSVVLAPHAYGPKLTKLSEDRVNDTEYMFGRWDRMFGYLAGMSYTVCITEWGGDQDFRPDRTWMEAFVAYLSSRPFSGQVMWAWNPNSVDVKGYLEPDWHTPDPFKKLMFDSTPYRSV